MTKPDGKMATYQYHPTKGLLENIITPLGNYILNYSSVVPDQISSASSSAEGDQHYMKIDKKRCEQLRKNPETILKGISSQLCYDTVSYESDFWGWLKEKFGAKTVRPGFEFHEKANVLFC